jgi:hypothetical protein
VSQMADGKMEHSGNRETATAGTFKERNFKITPFLNWASHALRFTRSAVSGGADGDKNEKGREKYY